MAGVSTATVSRVINQTAWVEPVTRERVEKAMRDLNYRRNAAAIALAKRSGDMLGLLTGNLADPFFARLARGVEDVSRKQQYRLMVCSGGHDEEMEKAGLDFLVNQGCEAIVMPVIMILICVGGLIGTWMFSGTIPYMVYWGLKLISPEYILIAAFFLTSVVSVCTGTSWGSAGTVGVALMGVAAGLDVSLAAAAGAVVSGAYFGDKISPLSDSTNFAAIVADTTLFEHIQHLLWTTLPSFLLAAVVYLIAGHSNMLGEVATPQRVTDIIHSLESLYHFNIVLILPPVIVLWGAIRKKPVIPLMLSACVLALFLGVIMQGLSIKQGLDAFIDGFDIAMFPQGAEGVVADVPRLLNRGGMFSMMGTILLVFCAFSFAGALTLTGALTIIINRLLTIIHSVGQLIAATIGTTILVTGATSDGKLALLVPAELFKDAYRRMGLDTKNLSRTIEDAGTVIEPLLPWTSAGVYMATTLGVSTLDLLPWAIQCYAAIFFALIYGFSGIGIARTAPASEKSPQSSVTE